MPTDTSTLTLALILTAGGATAAAALVTGLVEIVKRFIAPVVVAREWEFRLAALFSLALVVLAYVSQLQSGALTVSLESGFLAFLGWYGITVISGGIYDQVSDLTKPQTP